MGHSWNKRRGRYKQRYPYDKYMNLQNTFAFKSVTKYILSNIIKYYTSILKLHSEICLSMSSCLSGQQFASDFQSRKLNLLLSQETVLPQFAALTVIPWTLNGRKTSRDLLLSSNVRYFEAYQSSISYQFHFYVGGKMEILGRRSSRNVTDARDKLPRAVLESLQSNNGHYVQ